MNIGGWETYDQHADSTGKDLRRESAFRGLLCYLSDLVEHRLPPGFHGANGAQGNTVSADSGSGDNGTFADHRRMLPNGWRYALHCDHGGGRGGLSHLAGGDECVYAKVGHYGADAHCILGMYGNLRLQCPIRIRNVQHEGVHHYRSDRSHSCGGRDGLLFEVL